MVPKMKFNKDKKYSWISQSEPFEAEWASDCNYHDVQCTKPIIFKESLRWEIDNFRNFSAYDSPKCVNKYGEYVKANYVLALNYQTECQDKKTWLTWRDQEWAFETKKEMMEFLNEYMECMMKGEKGEYGYVNGSEFKIVNEQEV